MSKKLVFPEGVTDKAAFIKMKRHGEHQIIQNPIYIASDGTEINLASLAHHVRKKARHLPDDERDKVDKLKQLHYKVNANYCAQKRLAFGIRSGKGFWAKDGILENRREELIEYFGRMYELEEVLKIVNLEWEMPISKITLQKFKTKYLDEINRKIEDHKHTYHNIRLSIKKSRFEELQYLYNKAKQMWEDNPKREDLRILITLLEQLRKEAEGDRLTVDGKVDITYEQNINVHLMKEVFSTMNIKEIILARVAARMSVNPVKLLYSLNNSYYRQFSNVLGNYDEDEAGKTEVVYPSQLNYDFEKIGQKFKMKDKDIEDAILLDVEETKNKTNVDKAKSLKESLREKLSQKSKNLNDFVSKVNSNNPN